ncbi:MAG: LapA family protein [Phycisphaerales bacterium]|nr:MAG: LapA family protein [Phycisphaerales bacterium]
MKRVKVIAVVVLSILAVIVCLQNTEVVETKILFASVKMSRALLLIVTFGTGLVVGLLVMSQLHRRFRPPAARERQ